MGVIIVNLANIRILQDLVGDNSLSIGLSE